MKDWWLVKTKPRKDEIAELNLKNQEYVVYRPLAKRLKKQGKLMVEALESLFPGYLFVQLDQINDNWAPIRSTKGVSRIITFGQKPARVENSIIETLIEQEEEFSKRAIDLDKFKEGDQVVIKDGPFRGHEAIFKCYNGEQRAILLINFLQSEQRLTLDTVQIGSA